MQNNCQNCNQLITENFCSNCGQKKYKRIDKKYIWDEIQYTTIHTNKGFLYSVKKIIKNPGKAAREFIDGNRVNYYKPISLAFILSGISAFISIKIIRLDQIMKAQYATQKVSVDLMNDIMSFTSSYNSIFMLLLIPLFAIFTKIAFLKWGQNYYEHIVMNAFGLSFYVIFCLLILYPILYLTKDNPSLCVQISSFSMLIVPLTMVWFYKEFYKERTLKSLLLRILLIVFMVLISYFIFIIIFTILYIVIKGPQALEYLKPK